jgi:RNA recognition motif-containing protein
MHNQIFTNAISAIKANYDRPLPTEKIQTTQITSNKKIITIPHNHNNNNDSNQNSILSRIKVTKKVERQPKSLLTRKEKEEEDPNKLFTIQRKVIKKDISTRLAKNSMNSIKNEGSELWKHDLFHEEPTQTNNSLSCSIFIRNLPDTVDNNLVRKLFSEEADMIGGVAIDRGSAEVHFLRKDSAQRAVDSVNGKMLMGKKLKAGVISDLNAATLKPTSATTTINTNIIEFRKHNNSGYRGSRMSMDEEDDNKGSIISRIKKNH